MKGKNLIERKYSIKIIISINFTLKCLLRHEIKLIIVINHMRLSLGVWMSSKIWKWKSLLDCEIFFTPLNLLVFKWKDYIFFHLLIFSLYFLCISRIVPNFLSHNNCNFWRCHVTTPKPPWKTTPPRFHVTFFQVLKESYKFEIQKY